MPEEEVEGMVFYEGRVYVRPVSRGIILIDHPQDLQLEDLPRAGFYDASFAVWPLSGEDEKKAADDMRRRQDG